jgi:hypothetical protein
MSGHLGFMVNKVALRQVSPANLHSTNCSTVTIIYHLGLIQLAISGRSIKWTQSPPTKKNTFLSGGCMWHIPPKRRANLCLHLLLTGSLLVLLFCTEDVGNMFVLIAWQSCASCLLFAGFLLGVLFHHNDGENIFLRNVADLHDVTTQKIHLKSSV